MYVRYRFSWQQLSHLLWNLAGDFDIMSERRLSIWGPNGCIINDLWGFKGVKRGLKSFETVTIIWRQWCCDNKLSPLKTIALPYVTSNPQTLIMALFPFTERAPWHWSYRVPHIVPRVRIYWFWKSLPSPILVHISKLLNIGNTMQKKRDQNIKRRNFQSMSKLRYFWIPVLNVPFL